MFDLGILPFRPFCTPLPAPGTKSLPPFRTADLALPFSSLSAFSIAAFPARKANLLLSAASMAFWRAVAGVSVPFSFDTDFVVVRDARRRCSAASSILARIIAGVSSPSLFSISLSALALDTDFGAGPGIAGDRSWGSCCSVSSTGGIGLFDDDERDGVVGKLPGMGPLVERNAQLKGTWTVLGTGPEVGISGGRACDAGGFGSWFPSPGSFDFWTV